VTPPVRIPRAAELSDTDRSLELIVVPSPVLLTMAMAASAARLVHPIPVLVLAIRRALTPAHRSAGTRIVPLRLHSDVLCHIRKCFYKRPRTPSRRSGRRCPLIFSTHPFHIGKGLHRGYGISSSRLIRLILSGCTGGNRADRNTQDRHKRSQHIHLQPLANL
jgi:hypothetical protein